MKLVDVILCSRIRQLADLLEELSRTGATTPAALQCSGDAAGPLSMCFFFDIVVQFWQVLSNGQKHIKNR